MAKMKLLIENYVAQLQVGIYENERGQPQRVRISIAAELKNIPDKDHIDSTYNYMNVIEIISEMAARHYDLLESFARELADRILTNGQITQVEVQLLKLDIIAEGQLGVRYNAP